MVDSLRSLLHASHLLAPDDLASTVAAHARSMGARETVLYLADYEQATLVPLPGAGVPERQELAIEATLAGRAFRRVEVVTSSATAGLHRLWLPLLDGVERLGVVELVLPAEPDAELQEDFRALMSLVAELVVTHGAYGDVFTRLRRRRTFSLAAEIQWELLPPLTFGTERIVITGGLEPAYDIGGDTFDYAVNGDTADLLILDSVGHGLPAAVLASVAVGAYRHARRTMLDLPDIAQQVNDAIAGQFGASQFATAVLARLDLDTGRLRWINAGHPAPLILRGSSLVRPPPCPPSRPLGLQDAKPDYCETRLEPGDRLLLYTDGITEARSPDGEFFGEQRLADFIAAAVAAGDPAPEMVRRLMRRLLAHQADQLQDDATIVVLEWRTGEEHRMLP
ncbi:MAG: PP2C family protein-serine/threonine phosphatase [Friedmanniella sp.]